MLFSLPPPKYATHSAREIEGRRKNKKGMVVKWYREDFFISGPSVFFNNIAKVAKVALEHLCCPFLLSLLSHPIGLKRVCDVQVAGEVLSKHVG